MDTRSFSLGAISCRRASPSLSRVYPLRARGREIDFSEVSLHFQEPRSLFTGCASTVSACSTGGELFCEWPSLGLDARLECAAPSMQRSFEIPRAAVRGDVGYRNNLGVYGRSRVLLPAGGGSLARGQSRCFILPGECLPVRRFDLSRKRRVGGRRFVEASSGFIRDGFAPFPGGGDFLGAPVPRDRWFVEGIWREQHGPWQLAGAATLMRDSRNDA